MSDNARQVVVIGASAAGLRCASRLARLKPHDKVTVVEQNDVFSYAACGLPYVLAGDIGDTDALRRTGDGMIRDVDYFSSAKGVVVLAGWRAERIDPTKRSLRIKGQNGERELYWDELVLATGARPRRLPNQPDHPRVRSFHTINDVAPLHDRLARGEIQRVILIGAGLVGCELAEAFGALWGVEVTMVEAAHYPLPGMLDAETGAIVAQALLENQVRLVLGTKVENIRAREKEVTVWVGGESLTADVAVVAVGMEPAIELAQEAGIEPGPTGAIPVDDRLATSVPHVWAVGDCAQLEHVVSGEPVYLPLGSLANRQGRTLANVLAGREDRFPPVAGAMAVKIFDCNVAGCGLTRTEAQKRWEDVRSVCVSAQDRPHYWPDTKDIALHLVYRSGSHQVVGLQAVGEGDVSKRVDIATQLLHQGAGLEQLANLEHVYAPPYAPALDPLAVAAFAAQNIEDGIEAVSPEGSWEGARVLDVRHPEEREARSIPGKPVTEIPLAEVRRRIGELEGDGGPWLVTCERGARAAETTRFLKNNGISARYLSGGMRWQQLAGKATAAEDS